MNKRGIRAIRYWESRYLQEYAAILYANGDGYFACSLEGVCHDVDQ
jgi:hypothetical protein